MSLGWGQNNVLPGETYFNKNLYMKTWNLADKNVFSYDEYSHWIDYITYWLSWKDVVEPFFTDRIFDLDTDNSNFGAIKFHDEILSINKYKAPTGDAYAFSCVHNSISIPIFEITEFSTHQRELCNNQWGVIHFYGAYYRLIELENFTDDFIKKINNLFLSCPISRLDYRFDFCTYDEIVNIPLPQEVLPRIRKNKKRKLYMSWEQLESWEVWRKSNKTIFIRLYNKLKELNWNLKKTYLYSDIDKFKTFFRLEYEFWFKWCAWYTGKNIDKLIDKAFHTSWIESDSFNWNLYKPQIALDLKDKIDQLRYIKIFKSMAKNLKHNWIDPILLIEDLWV